LVHAVLEPPALLWFRQDLRLQDNPALHAAMADGRPVLPVYILDDAGDGEWSMGAASRWWLHHSLAALDAALRERGSRLILARGDSETILKELAAKTGARSLFWNRRYEPSVIARDATIKAAFTASGMEARSFNGALLNEPHTIANKQGGPFQVFTAYWRTCLAIPVAAPIKLCGGPLPAPANWPKS
jgi:deoxyribodipyrimidine photo-lyase